VRGQEGCLEVKLLAICGCGCVCKRKDSIFNSGWVIVNVQTGRDNGIIGGQQRGEDLCQHEEGRPWQEGVWRFVSGGVVGYLLLLSPLHQNSFVKPQFDTVPGAI
jgi:hypothetical protein